MAEDLGLGFGETASVEMLPEHGSCRPKARSRLASGSGSARWALTCCLVSLSILAGLTTYLLIGQLRAQGEACVFQLRKPRSEKRKKSSGSQSRLGTDLELDPVTLVAWPHSTKTGTNSFLAGPLDQILEKQQQFTPKGQELGPSHQRVYAPPGAGRDKPRAHLTVVRQTSTEPLKNQFPALHWEHELGLAFTKNRMNYTNKFLVIPESGDYFIYSQVTFRGTTSECGEISQERRLNKPDSIIVVITKVTDSYPEPTQLLMGTKSVCEIGSNWFQPIYLGAMFSLHEGDKLMVNVSDISLVDYTKEDKTFFGAFLL